MRMISNPVTRKVSICFILLLILRACVVGIKVGGLSAAYRTWRNSPLL